MVIDTTSDLFRAALLAARDIAADEADLIAAGLVQQGDTVDDREVLGRSVSPDGEVITLIFNGDVIEYDAGDLLVVSRG
jgi:hypothetical protein